jgi:hypothetical protein
MRLASPLLVLLAAARLAAADGDDPAALKQRVAELEKQVKELSQNAVPYRTLVELDAQIWLHGDGSDEGNAVPPKLARLLGLSAEETTALDEAFLQARKQLAAALAAQHPKAVVDGAAATLVVQDFSDEGKITEGQLQKACKAVLGPDRNKLFKRMLRNNDNQAFLNFGDGTQTFTFTKRGNGQLEYRQETKSDHGGGSSSGGIDRASLGRFALILPYFPKGWFDAPPAAGDVPAKPAAERVKGSDNF